MILNNKEHIERETKKDPTSYSNPLVEIFTGKRDSIHLKNELNSNKVTIIFKHNPNSTGDFKIDLNEILANDDDFGNAIHTNKTLPQIF